MKFDLVYSGALGEVFELIDILSSSLISFAEDLVTLMTTPIATLVINTLKPVLNVPIIGDILSFLTVDTVLVIFGSSTIPQFIFGTGILFYIVYTIGKWITDLVL